MINPLEFTEIIKKQVCKDLKRKYYRFRKTHFYGGSATADCLGCNLRCIYCWAQKKVWEPKKFGAFYISHEVYEKLNKMNLSLFRISGGEPTICKSHLFDLINLIPRNKLFILETNGILLNEEFVKELSKFSNIFVRVSLKGINKTTFERITGAEGKFFDYQLNALKLLQKYRIYHRPAILFDLFTDDQIKSLGLPNLEYESLIKYPFIMKNLRKSNIKLVREL
jgi:uncharacterized Fe-S cluster-containing radical SAM superfamily protein